MADSLEAIFTVNFYFHTPVYFFNFRRCDTIHRRLTRLEAS